MAEQLNLVPLLQRTNISMGLIQTRIRRFQIHEINRGRRYFGEYHHLFPLLKNYPNKFHQYMRMNTDTFSYILSKLENSLTKNWCNLHTQPILPEERLVLTLRWIYFFQYFQLHLCILLLRWNILLAYFWVSIITFLMIKQFLDFLQRESPIPTCHFHSGWVYQLWALL